MWFKKRAYLDYAAGWSGNPSSSHEEGRQAKAVLENARRDIARLLEVQADDVIFTSGATEANALAILGFVHARNHATNLAAKPLSNVHVLYMPSAHASVVENMKLLAEEGAVVETLPIKDARVDTDALTTMLRPETVLVSMDAVCGETGVMWNTREVATVLQLHGGFPKSHLQGGPRLHVDASQAPLIEKITRAHFGADLLTFDVSKISAARGIGALVAHRTIPLTPLYRGGGQERGLRTGSETPELADTFARALEAAVKGREAFCAAADATRKEFIKTLADAIPGLVVTQGRVQAPHILNISLPGYDTDYLAALLDDAGFSVSTRSACETDSEEGSRAVFALTRDSVRAASTLRISWGPQTSRSDLLRLVGALTGTIHLAKL